MVKRFPLLAMLLRQGIFHAASLGAESAKKPIPQDRRSLTSAEYTIIGKAHQAKFPLISVNKV